MIYEKATDYVNTGTTLDEQIVKIQAIINGLINLSLTAIENEIYEEYQVDDGQSVIKTRYRGLSAILASIKGYQALMQSLINQKQGHVFTLVDGINFPGRCY